MQYSKDEIALAKKLWSEENANRSWEGSFAECAPGSSTKPLGAGIGEQEDYLRRAKQELDNQRGIGN